MNDAWDILANYESQELVRRRFKEKHGLELNAGHASSISAYFLQGASYFRSASSADRVVKPLLLYYGAQCLARGATIFLRPRLKPESLSQTHGLTAIDWGGTFADPKKNVGDVVVEVNRRGTVQEFADATGNQTLVRLGTSVVNKGLVCSEPREGQRITLTEMMGRIPELAPQLTRWRPSDVCCAIGSIELGRSRAGSIILRISDMIGTTKCHPDVIERITSGYRVLGVTHTDESWEVSIQVDPAKPAGMHDIPQCTDLIFEGGLAAC